MRTVRIGTKRKWLILSSRCTDVREIIMVSKRTITNANGKFWDHKPWNEKRRFPRVLRKSVYYDAPPWAFVPKQIFLFYPSGHQTIFIWLPAIVNSICIYIGPFCYFSTVFVDKRLWKTKHPRKRVQNFRQSCVLLTDRIKIHQSQPDSIWWQLVIAIDGFRSHLSITRKTEGRFGHVSVAVLFSKVVYQRKRW